MAKNPACLTFIPRLSPFIDGELAPADRTVVERHLAVCQDCTARVADLRAESGLIRVGMEMSADQVDFSGFAQKVMARITPERPPLFERLRLSLSELFIYHRGMMVTSLATAAVVLLVAVPLLLRAGPPVGYASEHMAVEVVHAEAGARIAPVVMKTEDGDAIIWLVGTDEEDPDDEKYEEDVTGRTRQLNDARPQGGEL